MTQKRNNNKAQGNFIGTDAVGNTKAANKIGVFLDFDSTGNLIGGTEKADRNLISGNNLGGVSIWVGSDNNKVQGNYIGTTASGDTALGNGVVVVRILEASENLIGGPEVEARNLISGNSADGVSVENAASQLNRIMHNRIGTTADGTAAMGNTGHGVILEKAAFTIVGSDQISKGNVITGNTLDGVHIKGEEAALNVVIGNYIGRLAA